MGLDLNKMKAKLAALKGNGGGGSSVFWKPQEGEQTIRILPTEDGDPFKDYHFHYMNINGKNQSVMCPKRNFGKPAPSATSLPISGTKVKMALLVPAMKLRSCLQSSASSRL